MSHGVLQSNGAVSGMFCDVKVTLSDDDFTDAAGEAYQGMLGPDHAVYVFNCASPHTVIGCALATIERSAGSRSSRRIYLKNAGAGAITVEHLSADPLAAPDADGDPRFSTVTAAPIVLATGDRASFRVFDGAREQV